MLDDTAAPAEAVAETPAATPETTPAPAKDTPRVEEPNAKEAAEKALDDDLRKAFRNSKRERADDGKFAPKDGITPPKAKEAAPAPQVDGKDATKAVESKPDQQPEAGKVEPGKPQPPAIDAPASWSSEMKAKWSALPSEAQQYVAQREQEAHSRISQLGQYAKQMEPIHKEIAENSSYIKQTGKHPAQFIGELFRAAQNLDRDPVQGLKDLAAHYRVDPFSLIDDGTQPKTANDPVVSQLRAEIAELKQNQQHWATQQEQRAKAEADAKFASVSSEIDAFAKDKADWSELQADIIASVAAIREQKPRASNAEVLQEAYDRARWANPTTRARMQQELQAQSEAKRIEEAKKAAATASTASRLNVSGSRPQAQPADMDADMRAIWRKNRS